MGVRTVFFDADGVLQHAAGDWADGFARCLGDPEPQRQRQFTEEILAIEASYLSRMGNAEATLRSLLARWNRGDCYEQIVAVMTAIHLQSDVLDIATALRRRGLTCFVASNQQPLRARFMSEQLGFATHFDGELYSCNLGFAKPDRRYFERALSTSGAEKATTLFIDDRAENVAAALDVGLQALQFDGRRGAAALTGHLADFGVNLD